MTAESRALFARRRDAIHERSFAPASDGNRHVGAEVELLVYDDETNALLPLIDGARSLVGLLRQHASALAWIEVAGYGAVPKFETHDGAVVSFEPGGQLEISSRAYSSGSKLAASLRETVTRLRDVLVPHGVRLDSVGIDPYHDAHEIPQQLPVQRYRAMTDYVERIGPYGIRMMRQTAAIQVSVDRGSNPASRWHLLNDLAPYLTAIFANSPRYHDEETGHRSYRARCWRMLDVSRTGVFSDDADPATAYTAFALGAGDMLRTDETGVYRAYGDWPAESQSDASWENHLTTLFPDVRPRGHFEVRSCDAIDPAWYVVPIVLISGLAYDARSAHEGALLASESAALLHTAGKLGLRDESIARTARDLFQLALQGAARLGNSYFTSADLETAREYYSRYTDGARSPADDSVTVPPALPRTSRESAPFVRDRRGSAESSP
ncbi:MAG TPA: glutamate-cysteine ligase family protein [Gemmatimonadaceae bacterium]|jgi:glutamate--cysteine ligase